MQRLATTLRQSRNDLGYSQVHLAGLSGVSLPTIQNIEARKANPSFEVIEKLSKSLGLSLELKPTPADWDRLSACGVPLLSKTPQTIAPDPESLIKQIQLACRELSHSDGAAISDRLRKEYALQATLWALESYFPNFYKRHFSHSPLIQLWLAKEKTGELVKLRRIAVENLSRYL